MRRVLTSLLALPLLAQSPAQPLVQTRRLPNGAQVILVPRRGAAAFHADLFFRQGGVDEPGPLVGATELLARSLFGRTWPEDVDEAPGMEELLRQDESLYEELRVARVQQRRGPDPGGDAHVEELEAGLAALREKLRARLSPEGPDLYEARGGREESASTRDMLVAGAELPREAFAFWCRTEAARLKRLQLSRLPFDRDALLEELHRGGYPKDPAVAVLLGAALPGHPYGRDLADYAAQVEAIRRSELKDYARRACSADRMAVVIVGDLDLDEAGPVLDQTLGALPPASDDKEAILPELNPALGDRKVQILGAEPRLLVSWRVPPRTSPDYQALELLAQILAGGPTARLQTRLIQQLGAATELSASLGRPGARYPDLFIIEARPAKGHTLEELEAAIHSEILTLQQEPIPLEEWQKALGQLELANLGTQSDARNLAVAMGMAWVQTGQWRSFFEDPRRYRALGPDALQRAAVTYLLPSHRTTVAVAREAFKDLEPLDLQVLAVLQTLAQRKVKDPAQREALVTEGLRQLQMLPRAERERTLKLLQSQLKEEKP